MLALPLNRGSSVNISESYFTFLKSIYGENTEILLTEISSFQILRDSAVLVYEPTAQGLQTLLKLNYHYTALAPRLNGYQNELRTSYRWQDGFRTSKSIATTCLYVDWGCFMLNLAALQSNLGAKMERSTDEGIKQANKYFQQSAGIYEYVLHNILPLCTSTKASPTVSGLSVSGVTMARDLMLAQAQLCFYEKAVREKKAGNMKAAVVAKLSLQTSLYFDSVKKSIVTEPLSSTLDPSWKNHVEYQISSFKAASEFWQSISAKELALEKGKGYAEEIARLARAEKILTAALKEGQRVQLNATILQTGDNLLKTITSSKSKAEQDNNSIYMENIPNDSVLTAIVPASMVKPLNTLITEYSSTDPPLFKKVMPSVVRQQNNSFNSQMESIIMKASTDVGTASNAARTALSAMGLPGSLEAYKAGGQLPDNLWNKIQHAQTMGGKAELDMRLTHLEGSASRSMQSMATIYGNIQREERSDNDFVSKYPSWSGMRSSVLNMDIKASLQQMKDTFSQAQDSDAVIKKELQDSSFVDSLRLLSMSRAEISKLLPAVGTSTILLDLMNDDSAGHRSSGSASATGGGVNTSALENKLVEMAQIIDKRQTILAELESIGNKDITQELMDKYVKVANTTGGSAAAAGVADTAVDLSDIITKHLGLTAASLASLAAADDRQTILLREISQASEQFQRACVSDPTILSRNKVIQNLEQTITRFLNVLTQLSAGVTFYSNFQSRLLTLQQHCDDLIYTQQLQRQEFEHNLSQEQLRQSQESQDREYAERLAKEMAQVSVSSPSHHATAAAGNGNGSPAATVSYPQLPAASRPSSATVAGSGASSARNLMSSSGPRPAAGAPLPGQQSAPSPYEVSYGQPINGPPASYQYNPSPAYPTVAVASPTAPMHQPAAPAAVASSMSTPHDLHDKALRLAEMGFSYDKCVDMLKVNNGDEVNALNSLLSAGSSGGSFAAATGSASSRGSISPPKPAKPSGLFNNWNKK